jgi:hypothetical protein
LDLPNNRHRKNLSAEPSIAPQGGKSGQVEPCRDVRPYAFWVLRLFLGTIALADVFATESMAACFFAGGHDCWPVASKQSARTGWQMRGFSKALANPSHASYLEDELTGGVTRKCCD